MEFLIVFLVAAFAAIAQAAVGFGFAVLFTPLLALALGARDAIALSLILSMTLSLVLYLADKPRAPIRSVLPMFIAATVVTPIGTYFLAVADERLLRLAIGAAVLASVIGTMLSPHPAEERRKHMSTVLGVGVVSGIMRGATGMGGPPVVIYEHWRGAAQGEIRRYLLAYFALTGVTGTLLAAASGVIAQRPVFTTELLLYSLAGLPAAFIALYGGRYLRPRLSDFWFRTLSMALLLFTAAVSILGAIR